jgi:hypothetical protein
MILYKYRTLDDFKFVLDILVNQRLYATTYDEMNDPMEGVYTHDNGVPQESLKALEDNYKKIKFCSLSSNSDNPLMWVHYSKGARGIAIAVELKEKTDCREVNYKGPSHILQPHSLEVELSKRSFGFDIERAKRVLCYKNEFWEYEEEYRAFAGKGNFIDVKVKQIIFGEKADRTDKALLKKIIKNLDYDLEVIEKGSLYVY